MSVKSPPTDEDLSGKYLTFTLNDESYGVEILRVQEIIGVIKITHVPKTPNYLKGVINLRGKIVPIVDLRLKFNMTAKEYDANTCFIVVNIQIGEQVVAVGVVVDSVEEVVTLDPSEIQNSPQLGHTIDQSFIVGMGKQGPNVFILIDIEKALEEAKDAIKKAS